MHFLDDECVSTLVAAYLKLNNHIVYSVFEESRGAQDDDLVQRCFSENYILITADKDFRRNDF